MIRGKKAEDNNTRTRLCRARLDKVNRQFKASAPNVLWVSDFTYVATWQGFVYVAFVIDACKRRAIALVDRWIYSVEKNPSG